MILCVGSTGSGKTLLLKSLAENSTPGTNEYASGSANYSTKLSNCQN